MGVETSLTVERGAEVVAVAGHDRARITVLHDAQPTIHCRGRAEVKLVTRDRSCPSVIVEDRASLRAESLGASAPRIAGAGSCQVLLLARDTSTPFLEVLDAGQFRVVVQDDAQPWCRGWPEGWRARPSEIYVGQRVAHLASAAEAEAVARRYVEEWQSCRNRLLAAVRVGNTVPMLCADAVDVRWRGGTVHIELPAGDGDGAGAAVRPWLSHDAHDPHPFTEAGRAACTKVEL